MPHESANIETSYQFKFPVKTFKPDHYKLAMNSVLIKPVLRSLLVGLSGLQQLCWVNLERLGNFDDPRFCPSVSNVDMDWTYLQQVNEEMIGTVNLIESKFYLRKHHMNIKQTSSTATEASQGIYTRPIQRDCINRIMIASF